MSVIYQYSTDDACVSWFLTHPQATNMAANVQFLYPSASKVKFCRHVVGTAFKRLALASVNYRYIATAIEIIKE